MPDEYDLRPEEPKPVPPAPPTPPAPPAAPAASVPPPGFVPPEPIIEYAGIPPEQREDVDKHRGVAIAAYILFLIPLLIAPNSRFARYHANQGVLLFIVGCGVFLAELILGLLLLFGLPLLKRLNLDVLAWFGSCGCYLGQVILILLMLALAVLGIINAANGEEKPLPLIGHFTVIK